MYAVVVTGGKQYKVAPGDRLRVEKLDAAVGTSIDLDQIRLVSKEDGLIIDPSALSASKVVAEITAQGKGKKIRVFKKKRRKNYTRLHGHRQLYTELLIRDIQA